MELRFNSIVLKKRCAKLPENNNSVHNSKKSFNLHIQAFEININYQIILSSPRIFAKNYLRLCNLYQLEIRDILFEEIYENKKHLKQITIIFYGNPKLIIYL